MRSEAGYLVSPIELSCEFCDPGRIPAYRAEAYEIEFGEDGGIARLRHRAPSIGNSRGHTSD